MGGTPLLALSVTAFPEELPAETLGEILAGADEVGVAADKITYVELGSATEARPMGFSS